MLTTLEFTASLPKEVGNAKASCLVLILEEQLFVWIGDSSQPMLQSMHYAIQGRVGGGDMKSVTTLFGNRFHSMGERLSNRLCTMLGIPVVCSWNLSAGSSPQEQLDLLSNLLAKKIKEKYQSNREESTNANVAALSLTHKSPNE
jgi:hypothetical protein